MKKHFKLGWEFGEIHFSFFPPCKEPSGYAKKVKYRGEPEQYVGRSLNIGNVLRIALFTWSPP